ncbi:LysR family transcriptional regulator [Sinirhodobacter populi]|uniref:LysR family transcriptional regulator n=1 Tax=Paenirhodobacter populi TaxID=2306993 RepID=A0A443K4I7_9RHOB|nr:LysR substrate-binding domain-containing protein [Sinirhodobacter populi]RWR27676.1 LysR family transcriptional regulator [Sinirhodobacter populi]
MKKARITQKQTEAFRAVMMSRSMTGAARLLGSSQPAISRLIQDLEAETGLALFDRVGGGLLPTQAAFALAEEVERSFVGLRSITAFAEQLRRERAGHLRIAAVPVLTRGLLARFIVPFMQRHSGYKISVVSASSRLVVEAVTRGQADFGFTAIGMNLQGFSHVGVRGRAVVAMPGNHRLARQNHIAPSDLGGESFVEIRPGTLFATRVEMAFAGIQRQIHYSVETSSDACALIAAGAGVSVVDPLVALEYRGQGLAFRPLAPGVEAGFQSIQPLRQKALVDGSQAYRDARLFDSFIENFRDFALDHIEQLEISQLS